MKLTSNHFKSICSCQHQCTQHYLPISKPENILRIIWNLSKIFSMPFIYYKLPCKNKLVKAAVTGRCKYPLIQPNYTWVSGRLSQESTMQRKCKTRDIFRSTGPGQCEGTYLPAPCVRWNLDWEERGWPDLKEKFTSLCCRNCGRPRKPTRWRASQRSDMSKTKCLWISEGETILTAGASLHSTHCRKLLLNLREAWCTTLSSQHWLVLSTNQPDKILSFKCGNISKAAFHLGPFQYFSF